VNDGLLHLLAGIIGQFQEEASKRGKPALDHLRARIREVGRIADFMGHACRQAAHRCHLLAQQQLALGLPQVLRGALDPSALDLLAASSDVSAPSQRVDVTDERGRIAGNQYQEHRHQRRGRIVVGDAQQDPGGDVGSTQGHSPSEGNRECDKGEQAAGHDVQAKEEIDVPVAQAIEHFVLGDDGDRQERACRESREV